MTTEMNLTEDQINEIMDNDPSENKIYMEWMIKEVTKGTNMDMIKDTIKKLWEKKSPAPIDKTINEIISMDIPEIKDLLVDCKLLYYQNNLVVLRVLKDSAPILGKCPHWKEDFVNFHKDSKERERPVFIFINLKDLEKNNYFFNIFWKKKEEPSVFHSCMIVRCLGENSNKIFPMFDIIVPKKLLVDSEGNDLPEKHQKMVMSSYYFDQLNKYQIEWLKIKEIYAQFEKESIPFKKYFFNKELVNYHIADFWSFFPNQHNDKPSVETEPWIIKYYTKRIEKLKDHLNPINGYTDIQKATIQKIILEMEAICVHIKNLQQEIYRRPKLPE